MRSQGLTRVKLSRYIGLAAVLLSLSAVQAVAATPKNILVETARPAEGGRTIQVLVGQEEMKSDINPSNVVVATGGGLLGALVDAGINAERAKKAEAAIQPVRAALTGYDADALARDTTAAALAKVTWFQPVATAFSRDTSIPGKIAVLDASATDQIAFFQYSYDVAPDFSSVRVAVNIQIASKTLPAGKKPDYRLQPKALIYTQTLTSVVTLPATAKDINENAGQWAADNGKLARQAIVAGFGELGQLIPQALALSEADLKAMTTKTKKFTVVGGFNGRIQDQGPSGTLLLTPTGGLVHVQTVGQ
jgi:voltage-gated potassium channel Kch